MRTRVIVVAADDGKFRLRTEHGFPIGSRMLGVAPEPDKDYPELTDTFGTKLDANRAALRWNLYLAHAEKKKTKKIYRLSE